MADERRFLLDAKGLVDAISTGDMRKSLVAIRDVIANAIEIAAPHEVASLTKQLTIIIEKLSELGPEVVDPVDTAARSRAERQAEGQAAKQPAKRARAAPVPKPPAGGKQRGTRSGGSGGQRGAAAGPVAKRSRPPGPRGAGGRKVGGS